MITPVRTCDGCWAPLPSKTPGRPPRWCADCREAGAPQRAATENRRFAERALRERRGLRAPASSGLTLQQATGTSRECVQCGERLRQTVADDLCGFCREEHIT